ncbi:MAG: response regulator [Eubacteriales bacterium]|nr:response regulator [Eubacteriales bacterium]
MNKWLKARDSFSLKRIALGGTAILLVLLLLFLAVTLANTNKLASQIRLITEHPFAVNGDISDVKTNLALMRIRTERLQSYNQPEDVEKVRAALGEIAVETDALIAEIDELYLGPDEDIAALRDTYAQIQSEHEQFLAFARLPTSTTDVIARYEETHLYALYDQFEKDAQKILTFVRGTQQDIFISADRMSRSALISSVTIVIAMALGLFFFQDSLQKMSHRLYEKNRQFEILSDTIDETFMIFEPGQKSCEFVSSGAERVLGLPAGLLMKDRELVFQHMDAETAAQIRAGVNAGGQNTWETVIAYRPPQSAEQRWIYARFYRVTEHGGAKCIVTLADRTADQRANQALEDALVSAQNANNAKRDFLSRMSHEIRTPMNAIIGMTTIAAASMDDRRRVEDCLEKISYSSKHLLMLINDVLDMSRIESNRLQLTHEPFDLYQFINTFVSVVYPQACAKNLHFTEKTTGFSEHTTFCGDPLRLNQILLNLTSNAIKFTPSGGAVSLSVAKLLTRGKKSWIRFVVSDTGIGMDEEGLKKLYTPFEQADSSISGKYGGTGLGMSIVQNLTALMGGYIDVKSRPGEGTTFTVELPFEQSEVDLEPVREQALEALEVLVADDEKDICEHTTLLLKKMNIHAEWVLSGAEAVERVAAAQREGRGFDVCFIDWKMPDMDGVETTRRIRQKVGRDTPIIIISAYDWSEIEEQARSAGANAFIAKPLFQSSIYNVLVNVTNGAYGVSKMHVSAKSGALEGKRLLLAEDNQLNQEIAVTLLEMNGAAVETADDGRQAVDRFLETAPGYFDAILMDIQMPVMDGCEASRHIRASGRKDAARIPIIATTANAFTEDVSAALSAGMNAHISKPLDISQLCAVISQLCDGEKAPGV